MRILGFTGLRCYWLPNMHPVHSSFPSGTTPAGGTVGRCVGCALTQLNVEKKHVHWLTFRFTCPRGAPSLLHHDRGDAPFTIFVRRRGPARRLPRPRGNTSGHPSTWLLANFYTYLWDCCEHMHITDSEPLGNWAALHRYR